MMTFTVLRQPSRRDAPGEFGEGSVDLLPRIEDGENDRSELRTPGLVGPLVETSPRWRRGSRPKGT